MSRDDSLRVAIFGGSAQPGIGGGFVTALMALVRALGRLSDGHERYTIVTETEETFEWFRASIGPNQEVKLKPRTGGGTGRVRSFPGFLKRGLGPLLPAARYAQRLVSLPRAWPEVPVSDGFFEGLGCDVLHFPSQRFIVCAVPTVYNPHDLQHLHYPQFWSPSEIVWRETVYPTGCHLAQTVVVGSSWTKRDVVRQYRVSPRKVQVIPEGPPTHYSPEPTPEALGRVRAKYRLEADFALYPAVSWPHKNHVRLLEALAHLRDRAGLRIPLVCTGSRYEEFWPHIERRTRDLGLGSQVKFLGFVPEEELRAIYRMALFLVQPSLFEASSLPMFEAWLEGVPVTCANVTALPEQAMDAALLFEPTQVSAIAEAMSKMACDAGLRHDLCVRGYERLKYFDWDLTAKTYRAVYRRIGRIDLTDEDRWLLGRNSLREPSQQMGIVRER